MVSAAFVHCKHASTSEISNIQQTLGCVGYRYTRPIWPEAKTDSYMNVHCRPITDTRSQEYAVNLEVSLQ